MSSRKNKVLTRPRIIFVNAAPRGHFFPYVYVDGKLSLMITAHYTFSAVKTLLDTLCISYRIEEVKKRKIDGKWTGVRNYEVGMPESLADVILR